LVTGITAVIALSAAVCSASGITGMNTFALTTTPTLPGGNVVICLNTAWLVNATLVQGYSVASATVATGNIVTCGIPVTTTNMVSLLWYAATCTAGGAGVALSSAIGCVEGVLTCTANILTVLPTNVAALCTGGAY
jgi:hypothetical protein